MKVSVGLLVSVWALVCELILLLLPRDNYEQGAVSGVIIGLTVMLILLQARQPKKLEQPSEPKPTS